VTAENYDGTAFEPAQQSAGRSASRSNQLLWTTLVTAAIVAINFGTGMLLAHLLGSSGRGVLAALQLWGAFLAGIATLGLQDSAVYFSSRQPDTSRATWLTSTTVAVAASIPFVLLGYLLMPILLHAQSPSVVSTARLYLVYIPLCAVWLPSLNLHRGLMSFRVWNMLQLLPYLCWVATILCSLVTAKDNRPEFIAYGYLILFGLVCVPSSAASAFGRSHGRSSFLRKSLGEMLRYGLPSAMSRAPLQLNLRGDQMLMAAFLAPGLLGLYHVAVSWTESVPLVVSVFGYVAFPRIACLTDHGDQAREAALFLRLGVVGAVVATAVTSGLAPVLIPPFFGGEFRGAVSVALALAVSGVLAATNLLLREIMRGLRDTSTILIAELAGMVVGLGSFLLLVGPLELMGAAIACTVGYVVTSIILVRGIKSHTHLKLSALLIPRRADMLLYVHTASRVGRRVVRGVASAGRQRWHGSKTG
jgi:O-antigen/teichoic acid export membrane protein